MKRFLTPLMLAAFLAGCGAKPAAPTVGVYSFEENNYPCAKVEFPDQIRLKDTTLEEKGNDLAVVYDLEMPGYKIQVVKMYGGSDWSLDSLSSLKNKASKLYEIGDEENPDKSAVITVESIDGSVYLQGSVAEFFQNDRALRVDIFRRIKKLGSFKKDGVEQWKNSVAGNRTIMNMRNIVDYVYDNISSAECRYKEAVDMDWWNK